MCVCVRVCVCVCVYTYIYMCVCVCVCVYIYRKRGGDKYYLEHKCSNWAPCSCSIRGRYDDFLNF